LIGERGVKKWCPTSMVVKMSESSLTLAGVINRVDVETAYRW